MDLKEKSTIELKALAYDIFANIQMIERKFNEEINPLKQNLMMVNDEIKIRNEVSKVEIIEEQK